MKENINISEFDGIFRKQLENASAQPPAGVWEGISSGLSTASAASATAAAVKTALWVKIGIGAIVSAAIATVTYLIIPKENEAARKIEPISVEAPQIANETRQAEQVIPMVENGGTINLPISSPTVKKDPAKGASWRDEVASSAGDNGQKEAVPAPLEFKYNAPAIEKQGNTIVNEEKTIQKEDQKSDTPYEPKKQTFVLKTDSSFIFVPDVVTPDGDGLNDVYLIDIKGEESVRVIIFSNTMNKLFETTNKLVPWTCFKPDGELYPEANYIVKVIYKFPGSPEKIKNVTLKLIR